MSNETGGSALAAADNTGGTANLIYILYLASLVVGITALVGVVMADINRGKAQDWVEAHYRFQIRTFWMSLLYAVICMVLAVVTFGFGGVLFVALAVWLIVRCVKGMKWIGERRPPTNPASWLFG